MEKFDHEWRVLKSTISRAAMESLGQSKRTRKEMELLAWDNYMQEVIQEKKEAYLTHIQIHSLTHSWS
jgi:hypothetical protein